MIKTHFHKWWSQSESHRINKIKCNCHVLKIENKDKTATEKEINEFKEYINATYYLEKEKIHINE